MQPVTVTLGGVPDQGIFSGQEQAPITIHPSASSTSGTIEIPAAGTSNVTFTAKVGGTYSTPIKANSFPSGGITGTWTCSGSNMSLTVATPNGPTTLTMTRSGV
jgi:hypothetical protein